MGFIHIEAVNAQLLEGHGLIGIIVLQLLQAGFQILLGNLRLLDGEPLPFLLLHFLNDIDDFLNLLTQKPFHAFLADGDFLELGIAHDDRIPILGGNLGAELLALLCREVLGGGHEDFGVGI